MFETRNTCPINEGVSGYWDALCPEDLAEFDTAMDLVQIHISASRDSRENRYRAAIGEPIVGFSPIISDVFAGAGIVYIGDHMPNREAFEASPGEAIGISAYQLAQEGWKDLIRGRNLGTEEKERGITIAGDSPHTPGLTSGIKEVPGIPPEEQ